MVHLRRYFSLLCSISITAIAPVKQRSKHLLFNKLWAAILIIAALIFSSCVSHPSISPDDELILYPQETYLPEEITWTPISEKHDISYYRFENPDFPLIYHIVKINLQDEDLEITGYPSDPDTPKVYKSKRTQRFAAESDSLIAINASPFSGKSGKWDLIAKLGSTRQIVGVHTINGTQLSVPNQSYAALSFTKTSTGWNAKIIRSQTPQALENAAFAFGGFYVILEHGVEQTFRAANHDSRTAAGISSNGDYLFILVVEGEKPSQSEGLSYQQCARILKKMGCSDALEFDGGGSTQLCINGKSVLSYPNLRYQANSFGFK